MGRPSGGCGEQGERIKIKSLRINADFRSAIRVFREKSGLIREFLVSMYEFL
jgi:hypothetical protein